MKQHGLFLSGWLVLLLTWFMIPTGKIYAATFAAGNATELVDAINTANTTPQEDTILLTNDITLSTIAYSGVGDGGLPKADHNLTIEGQGYRITRGEGAPDFRIFIVEVGVSLTLNNVTVSNGASSTSTNGGGIFNSGTLTIQHSVISDNRSGNGEGGGIYNAGGIVNIINSTISGNTAHNSGGGISNTSLGTLTISESRFLNNDTEFAGGGFSNTNATTTVRNSTFSGNNSSSQGGGIMVFSGTTSVAASTFTDNSAVQGGALHNSNGTLTVSNSTISGNAATLNGGGLNNTGTTTLIHNTFTGNSGVGIYNQGTITANNNIAANNRGVTTAIINCNNVGGSSFTGAFNMANDLSCPGFSNSPSINLGTLANNGGSTQTIAPNAGSSVFDAAGLAACSASPVSHLDQRGIPRQYNLVGSINDPQVGDCDIGALEVGSIPQTLEFSQPASSLVPTTGINFPVSVGLDHILFNGYGTVTAYVWVSGGTAVAGVDYAPFGLQAVTIDFPYESDTVNLTLLNAPLMADRTVILSIATQNGPGFSGPVTLDTQLTHTVTLKISPANAAPRRNFYTTHFPVLSWTPISGATGYWIEVSSSPTFSPTQTLVYGAETSATQFSVETAFIKNGTYYWRVRAKHGNGFGMWSVAEPFEILAP